MRHLTFFIVILISIAFANSTFSFENAILKDKNNQLRKTSDGGKTWVLVPGQSQSVNNKDSNKNANSTVNAVVIKNGKRMTLDGGKTWKSETEENFSSVNKKLSVYPNPLSAGKINIIVPDALNGKSFDVKVCDVYGNFLFSALIGQEQTSSGLVNLDLKDINNGYYLLKVSSDLDEFVTGIVINR